MDNRYDMEPNHLRTYEVNYELRIRELLSERATTDVKRKCLRRQLRTDCMRPSAVYSLSPDCDLELEKNEITETISSLTALVTDYDGIREEVGRRMKSRATHVLGRLTRLPQDDEQIKKFRNEWIVEVMALEEQILQIEEHTDHVPAPRTSMGLNTTMNTAAIFTPKSIPVFKWGITFNGSSEKVSLSAFLQKVEELRVARSKTKEELFNEATDLFTGQAHVWFSSVKSTLRSWDDLVAALRRDFLPTDYDDELWEEIRRRTQGPFERVIVYITSMQGLFKRLVESPSGDEQLKVIKKNLLPWYHPHLALQDINDVSELADICRTLESANSAKKKYQPPPRRDVALLEPDLAYDSGTSMSSALHRADRSRNKNEVASLKCYGCREEGHIRRNCPKFRNTKRPVCTGCGEVGVIRPNCKNCSKN